MGSIPIKRAAVRDGKKCELASWKGLLKSARVIHTSKSDIKELEAVKRREVLQSVIREIRALKDQNLKRRHPCNVLESGIGNCARYKRKVL